MTQNDKCRCKMTHIQPCPLYSPPPHPFFWLEDHVAVLGEPGKLPKNLFPRHVTANPPQTPKLGITGYNATPPSLAPTHACKFLLAGCLWVHYR